MTSLLKRHEHWVRVVAFTGCLQAVGRRKPTKLQELTFNLDAENSASLIQILDPELYLYKNPKDRRFDAEVRRNNEVFPIEFARYPIMDEGGR